MLDNEKWKIQREYKVKITLKESIFILEQAEKRLNDGIETNKRIIDKSNVLLQIAVGLLIALIAYAIGKWEKDKVFDSNLLTTVVGVIYYSLLIMFFLIPNVQPNIYCLPGTQPAKYFIEKIYGPNAKEDERLLWLYLVEIENYQHRILSNEKVNDKRWRGHKQSVKLLIYSPFILLLIYAFTSYLQGK